MAVASPVQAPKWVKLMVDGYVCKVAHTFLLHLNIDDFVFDGTRQWGFKEYLSQELLGGDSVLILAYYDRATGITFYSPRMRDLFEKLLELNPGLGLGPKPKVLPNILSKPSEAFALFDRILRMSSADNEVIKKLGLKEEEVLIDPNDPKKGRKKLFALTINFAETLIPEGDLAHLNDEDRSGVVSIATWSSSSQIGETGNIIVLRAQHLSGIHSLVRVASSPVEAIKVPLPDLATRRSYLDYSQPIWAAQFPQTQLFEPELTPAAVASLTAGMTLVEMANMVKRAATQGQPLDFKMVWHHKKTMLESQIGDLIEIVNPKWGFEVIGGHDRIKAYLRQIALAAKAGDYLRVPVGILLMGPPGTGKTVLAEAFAKEIGFSMIKVKRIRDMWVGVSERNWDRFEEMVKAMAPVVIFTDEFDQEQQARGYGPSLDAGVSERLRGRQMAFMADTSLRGQVIWLSATNRPDLLDPAMLRSGRFDAKLAMLLPKRDGIKDIFQALFVKLGYEMAAADRKLEVLVTDEELAVLATLASSKRCTGADLELVCHRAYVYSGQGESVESVLDFKSLKWALDDLMPAQDTAEYDRMTDLALLYVNSRDLIPEEYMDRAEALRAPPKDDEFQHLLKGHQG